MRRLLRVVEERPRPCSYLPDERASLVHRLELGVGAEELEARLERGWRRFGYDYFRPACRPCDACRPSRVVVAAHAPTRSQRRVLRGASHLRLAMGPPAISAARLALHRAWHEGREERRGWQPNTLGADEYEALLAFDHEAAREVTFWDGDRLVGVSLVDETPRALSAIYFFHAPDLARLSLGTANVLLLLELARAAGKTHVYLGYRVDACPSLAYKGRFTPQEELDGRPGPDETPRWIPAAPRWSGTDEPP